MPLESSTESFDSDALRRNRRCRRLGDRHTARQARLLPQRSDECSVLRRRRCVIRRKERVFYRRALLAARAPRRLGQEAEPGPEAPPRRLQQCPGEPGVRRRPGLVARAVPSLRSVAGRRGRPRPDQPGARTRRSRPRRPGAAAPPGTAGAAETPANPGYGRALANDRCPEAGARSCSSIADRSSEKDCGAFGARLRSWCGVRRISRTERTALAPGAARGSVGSSEGDRDREEDEVRGSAYVHARAPGDPESPRLEKRRERRTEGSPSAHAGHVGSERPRSHGSGRRTRGEVGLAVSVGLGPRRRLSNDRQRQAQPHRVPRPRDERSGRAPAPM